MSLNKVVFNDSDEEDFVKSFCINKYILESIIDYICMELDFIIDEEYEKNYKYNIYTLDNSDTHKKCIEFCNMDKIKEYIYKMDFYDVFKDKQHNIEIVNEMYNEGKKYYLDYDYHNNDKDLYITKRIFDYGMSSYIVDYDKGLENYIKKRVRKFIELYKHKFLTPK